MIPPSLILIVYGVTINESISRLFIAGIIPGLTVAALFMGYVVVWSWLNPARIPGGEARSRSWRSSARAAGCCRSWASSWPPRRHLCRARHPPPRPPASAWSVPCSSPSCRARSPGRASPRA
ncbi:MAG: TRAP transporter large permease subunit [Geminicoccaceae bacterium]